ncbi:MAG TPA: hypothetical protein V6C71_07510 [Coleofasciculaceae cyanobacterium]|jgi:putative ABC transport system ATP-binding protein
MNLHTGALDSQTTAEILQIFAELNNYGMTVVVITHDPEVGDRAEKLRNIILRNNFDNNSVYSFGLASIISFSL